MTEADLNRLIQVDADIGTIRYVGPVHELKDNKEIWYGIEWRDPKRGKHDGSFKGTRYFETKHPTSGSFVRPKLVTFGTDIKRALDEKYFEGGEEINNGEDEVLYNNFDNDRLMLTCVNLASCRISQPGSLDFFKEKCPRMKELDLEGNLFTSWSQIFEILAQLKDLKLINVSNNSLTLPETSKFAFDDVVFENIEHLILNRMNYTWNEIEQVLKHFPNLIELKVCFNSIDAIQKPLNPSLLRKLKVLDLESNQLNSWEYLKKFGTLKELEILYANDTGISEVSFADISHPNKTYLFPKLKLLSINDNKISQWSSINELIKLPSLNELTMKFNPLNSSDSLENVRQRVISKLLDLKMFNRTKIMPDERKGSDIDYLKMFGKEWIEIENKDKKLSDEEVSSKKKAFLEEHPSYLRLVEKYGAAEKSEVNVQPETLNTSLISVNIKDAKTGKMLKKRFPLTTEIGRLKYLIIRLFKYSTEDADGYKLIYTTPEYPEDTFELDKDNRMLDFFAIQQGDTIILRPKLDD